MFHDIHTGTNVQQTSPRTVKGGHFLDVIESATFIRTSISLYLFLTRSYKLSVRTTLYYTFAQYVLLDYVTFKQGN